MPQCIDDGTVRSHHRHSPEEHFRQLYLEILVILTVLEIENRFWPRQFKLLGDIQLIFISACKMEHIAAICLTGSILQSFVRMGAHFFRLPLISMLTNQTNNVTRLIILVHAVIQPNRTQCQVVIREVTIMSTSSKLMDSSSLGKSMFREVHQLLCLYLTVPMSPVTAESTCNYLYATMTQKCLYHVFMMHSQR